jgi:hypothetical protein
LSLAIKVSFVLGIADLGKVEGVFAEYITTMPATYPAVLWTDKKKKSKTMVCRHIGKAEATMSTIISKSRGGSLT